MREYVITYPDGTEEVIISDKGFLAVREDFKSRGECSIKSSRKVSVNTPQIEDIQASIQEAIEPREEKPMKQATPETALIKKELLSQEGFTSVDCFWRHLNFAGWVAVKSA